MSYIKHITECLGDDVITAHIIAYVITAHIIAYVIVAHIIAYIIAAHIIAYVIAAHIIAYVIAAHIMLLHEYIVWLQSVLLSYRHRKNDHYSVMAA